MAQQALVLRHGTVCDVASGEARPQDVLVVDGIITEVGSQVSAPASAVEVDASGLHLVPGLIDAHVHVTAGSADLGAQAEDSPYYVAAQTSTILRSMLDRGFTTVRDVGGADFGIAAAVEEGLWPGPKVHFGGKALYRDAQLWHIARQLGATEQEQVLRERLVAEAGDRDEDRRNHGRSDGRGEAVD